MSNFLEDETIPYPTPDGTKIKTNQVGHFIVIDMMAVDLNTLETSQNTLCHSPQTDPS